LPRWSIREITTLTTRDANNVARFTIMTFNQFRIDCIELMHPLHAGIVASMFHTTIDDLISDAYAGEIDDLNDSTPECFTRWVDSTYTHLVN
jgi:hypothetical protein